MVKKYINFSFTIKIKIKMVKVPKSNNLITEINKCIDVSPNETIQ